MCNIVNIVNLVKNKLKGSRLIKVNHFTEYEELFPIKLHTFPQIQLNL